MDNDSNPRFTARRLWIGACIVIVVAGLGSRAAYLHFRWKRFATVEPGRVYRSGRLSTGQFSDAIDRLRLRTVINLDAETAERERNICRDRGIAFLAFDLPSSGLGRPEDFERVLAKMRDPAAQPILVHCSAGVARTGVAVALYRVASGHWTVERAISELASFERKGRIEPSLKSHVESMAFRLAGSQPSLLSSRMPDLR